MAWRVQEAKQKVDKLVQCALDEGPQVVTRQGEEVVVVLAKEEYNRSALGEPVADLPGNPLGHAGQERPRAFSDDA